MIAALPSDVVPTQTRISGGSSETDENAFAVIPYGIIAAGRDHVDPGRERADRVAEVAPGEYLRCDRRARWLQLAHALQPPPDHLLEVARRPDRLGDDRRNSSRSSVSSRLGGGADGRRARRVAHDRHLAEEAPRAEGPDLRLAAVLLAHDLDLAVDDDEELVRRAALSHQHLALLRDRVAELGLDPARLLLGRSVQTFSTSLVWKLTPNSSEPRSPAWVLSMKESWVGVNLRK